MRPPIPGITDLLTASAFVDVVTVLGQRRHPVPDDDVVTIITNSIALARRERPDMIKLTVDDMAAQILGNLGKLEFRNE